MVQVVRTSLAFCLVMAIAIPVMAADIPITNGDFELWTVNGAPGPPDNWTMDNSSFTSAQEAGTVHGGTYSVNLTWTSKSNQDFVSDMVAVTGDELYSATVWAYDDEIYGRIRVCLEWYDAGQQYLSWN